MLSKEVRPPRVALPTPWVSLLVLDAAPLATLLRVEDPISRATLGSELLEASELRTAEAELLWEELLSTCELRDAVEELRDAVDELLCAELLSTWELRDAVEELRDADPLLF